MIVDTKLNDLLDASPNASETDLKRAFKKKLKSFIQTILMQRKSFKRSKKHMQFSKIQKKDKSMINLVQNHSKITQMEIIFSISSSEENKIESKKHVTLFVRSMSLWRICIMELKFR
jgi:hypothetical protein